MEDLIKDMLNKNLIEFKRQGFQLKGIAHKVFDLIKLETFTEFLVGRTLTRKQFYDLYLRLENGKN